ncbi:hypothetical protein NUW58_g5439 [Xylaria curta]|uniref:Uncharacterized protein n=1 Tax=Xylaria curta TaxID=42375 RepID=A0ACC1P414_9PEZI|nr:hypothetical protein NUW58_g5439 [Xylaria curta]
MLGLDALQQKPENAERSHFTIAGIHGMPYIPFNGVGPVPGAGWKGYCPHLSPQLIPWHRAFLALYEQTLGDEVQALALGYTDENASVYREAAQKLRLPYWDWASDSSLPHSSKQEYITVNGPNGEVLLHNPLYNYRWQTYPLNETLFPGQNNTGPVTTRDKDSKDVASFVKDGVYRTFSSAKTYDEMASMSVPGSSFEAPHNAIHGSIAGSYVKLELTAFGALFYLHHTNLDRLAAMWTALHNDTIQTIPFTSPGLFSTAPGEVITADSPVKPFYQADGRTFHTGRTVAAIETFGYTYPEVPGGGQGRNENIIAQINKLYGNSTGALKSTAASKSGYQWYVEIQADRTDLPLPCSIDVYVGDSFAGRTTLLSMPTTGITHDELSLTRVVRLYDADNNDYGALENRLINDLRFEVAQEITTLDFKHVPPSLHVSLVREDVTPPSSESELPLYSHRTRVATVSGAALNG